MSSLTRMLSVLDLFSETQTTFTADQISESLDLTRATGYRYIRELSQVGLLSGYGGNYRLGPRITQLDYQIRNCDPLLKNGNTTIRDLAIKFRGNVIISSIYDDKIVNSHHERGDPHLKLSHGRGHVIPRGKGSTAKIIMANMKRPALIKFYKKYGHTAEFQKLGSNWKSFMASMRGIRADGICLSLGEIDQESIGISAPILTEDETVTGAITLILRVDQYHLYNEEAVFTAVKKCAVTLQSLLNEHQPNQI